MALLCFLFHYTGLQPQDETSETTVWNLGMFFLWIQDSLELPACLFLIVFVKSLNMPEKTLFKTENLI